MTKADETRRRLSPKQELAVDLVAAGATDAQAARFVGVTRQTVNGWKNRNPFFRAALNTRREEAWAASKDRLLSLLPVALRAIDRELRDGENASRVALKLIELCGLPSGCGDGGPTDPDEILDAEVRARRPDPTRRLLDSINGSGQITDEERRRVLDELCEEGTEE
jgi:hypothetical protein